MLINDMNEKAWKLLVEDCEGFIPFKNWNLTPTKLQHRYRSVVETEFYRRNDIVMLDMSQPQHTDFSFPLNCCYQYDSLIEARGGYKSNGGVDTLYIRDTKDNLLDWLAFVKESILDKYESKGTTSDNSNDNRDNFITYMDLAITTLSNSDDKKVKVPNVYDLERKVA